MHWLLATNSRIQLGGVETVCRLVARSLLLEGNDVSLLCYGHNAYEELSAEFPDRCRIECESYEKSKSLSLGEIRRCRGLLRRVAADAMFLFGSSRQSAFSSLLIGARYAGIRHIVIHHGGPPYPAPSGLGGRYLGGLVRGFHVTRRLKRLTARTAYRNLTHAVFNNAGEMEAWQHEFRMRNTNCRVWLTPADTERLSSRVIDREEAKHRLGLSGSFVFGSVARLAPAKSLGDLIRAFAALGTKQQPTRLLLVGDGEERKSLEQLAQELSVGDAVRFVGAQDDIVPFLSAMDVFVLPSIRESLGISIVEAMACGIPVIVTDLPGPRSVVDDGKAGTIVPPGNPEKLADAMLRLMTDQSLRKDHSASGLRRASDFDARTVVGKLLGWLDSSDTQSRLH